MNAKSFTLIELLVTIAIFTIVLGGIYLIFGKSKSLDESIGVEADLLTNARAAIQQIIIDLQETDQITLTTDAVGRVPSFVDPLNGQTHQILIFASARGDSAALAEDGTHANNNYFHIDPANNRPSWRSAVIYCTFVIPGPDGIIPSADDIQQLCRYVDFGVNYSNPGMFPLTLNNVAAGQISLTRGDASVLAIQRNTGRVVANYISTEDANNNGSLDANENDGNNAVPPDNSDAVLDRGADFNAGVGLIRIKIFLTKAQTSFSQNIRHLQVTLNNTAVMRN